MLKKKTELSAAFISKEGKTPEHRELKDAIIANSEKRIGLRIVSYPANIHAGIFHTVDSSISHHCDLKEEFIVMLSDDDAPLLRFILVKHNTHLGHFMEDFQEQTGSHKSRAVIDHGQFRISNFGSGVDNELDSRDYHIFEINADFLNEAQMIRLQKVLPFSSVVKM
ncbi:MAG: hypothetical protein NTX85_02255 [Candidatus Nomurabacteria bacterium]|nr:hypothetical protein [Candidatus Nomurabacteria bacterium]